MDNDPARPVDVSPVQLPPARVQRAYPLPVHRVWVTPCLLVLNALIFLVMWVIGDPTNSCLLLRFGAKFNFLIVQGEWWRLLTPIFLHIGFIHLLFNEYALWIFGSEIERLFGSPRFVVLYILSGLFGSLASFAFSPALSAGASGAIFGIIGAQAAFFFRNRENFGEVGRRQLGGLLAIIVVNLFFGLTVSGIDNFGHLGGLVSGFLLGLALSPLYELVAPDFSLGVGPRVVDRNSLLRSSWAVGVALLLLWYLFQWALGVTPVSAGDAAFALRCLR